MDNHDPFTRALLNANPDDCRRMLSERPCLASEPIARAGLLAHPLILLAQWPGRMPHVFDDQGFRSRLRDCADALFAHGADLRAPAAEGVSGSCAGALLARMRQHRELDERWGVPPTPSPEALIMQASLDAPSPEHAQRSARAWLDAAKKLRGAKIQTPFPEFLALARAVAERAAIEASAACPGDGARKDPRRL